MNSRQWLASSFIITTPVFFLLLLGTYKLKKRTLQAEAFSIRHVKDPIFFLDNKLGQYVPLTIQLHDDIVKGTVYIYIRTVSSKLLLFSVVCDQNLVYVSGTETKV